jgi:hypothetical protein
MPSRPKQSVRRGDRQDDSVSARRADRLDRIKAGRRRGTVLAISLASAGVLLLAVVGIVMAVAPGKAPADEPTPNIPVSAPAIATRPVETTTAEATGSDLSVSTPAEPAVSPAPAPRPKSRPVAKKKPAAAVPVQHLTINIGGGGYSPSLLKASSASPIKITVGKGDGCAAGFTIPSLGIQKDNSSGPVTFSLGRLKAGTYRFACEMDMIEGRIVVK